MWLQKNPNHHPSTVVLNNGYEVFLLKCYVWFLPNTMLGIKAKQHSFGLICPHDIVLDVLWFVQMQFCKHQSCIHILVRSPCCHKLNI